MTTTFEQLMTAARAPGAGFDHRAHVHLTWLAVRGAGMPAAIGLVSDGLQRTTRYAGVPQKYHATVSRAWVELVAHHAFAHPAADFAEFASRNPALLDKRLLSRFYRSATLASPRARTGWVEPDEAPFPWQAQQHAGLPVRDESARPPRP